MTKLPSINALRSFIVIARHGNISHAAEELFKTHGALSKQLSGLEDFMGAELVKRSSSGVELTYDGQQLFAVSNDIINDLSQKIESLKSSGQQHTINITLLPSFAARWLVSRLPELNKSHPELNINLSTFVRLADLDKEDFHLAIRYGFGDWPQYNVIPFIQPTSSPIVGSNNPLLQKSKITHEDIIKLELFHDCDYLDMENYFSHCGINKKHAQKGYIFDDYNIILQSVINGEGMTLGRQPLIDYDLKAKRLLKISDVSIPSRMKYFLVFAKSQTNNKSLQIFINWLINMAEKEGLTFNEGQTK